MANGIINFRSDKPLDANAVRTAVQNAGTGVKEIRPLGEAQGGGFDYQVVASGMAERVTAALSQGRRSRTSRPGAWTTWAVQVGKQLRNAA